MPSAYITALNRELEAETPQPPRLELRQRFSAWFVSQPEVSRHRPYSMTELERGLNTQGRFLSPILLSLGWQRRRKWSSSQQYLRYWVPPGM